MRAIVVTVVCAGILTLAAFAAQVLIKPTEGFAEASLWLLRMLSTLSWVAVISAWNIHAQRRVDDQHHKRVLKKARSVCDRLTAVEDRVNQLSEDRTQAAAAVTQIFRGQTPRT